MELVPIFCPSCNKPMNYRQDKKFYFLYKRCFNCQVDFEADIKQYKDCGKNMKKIY